MKEYIEYLYKLKIKELKNIRNDVYFVNTLENNYIYRKIRNPIEEVIEVNKILNYNHIERNNIILDKDGRIITNYEEDKYVLILIKYDKERYMEIEMPIFLGKGEISVVKRWESNVEKYKNLISKNKINNFYIRRLLNYFIGEAEIAISILNKIEKYMNDLYLQHKRIYLPNYGINYKDEMNFIVDYKSRDIAEFYKMKILKGYYEERTFLKDIDLHQLNENEKKYFIARMIYPSYFFEEIDKINAKEIDDKKIICEIDIVKKYGETIRRIADLLVINV